VASSPNITRPWPDITVTPSTTRVSILRFIASSETSAGGQSVRKD
jgi:hypothetical protein